MSLRIHKRPELHISGHNRHMLLSGHDSKNPRPLKSRLVILHRLTGRPVAQASSHSILGHNGPLRIAPSDYISSCCFAQSWRQCYNLSLSSAHSAGKLFVNEAEMQLLYWRHWSACIRSIRCHRSGLPFIRVCHAAALSTSP